MSGGILDGDVIECACHGSCFRLDDGAIVRGSATSPEPAFDVRERDGRIEVRRRATGLSARRPSARVRPGRSPPDRRPAAV